ncbi:MAG: transmembrane fusion protein, partial [Desulfobacula sp.]|nr:transmembrane fusion protein [Desulfobacula sp.]
MQEVCMQTRISVTQSPTPGESKVMYCGDSIFFQLTLSSNIKGKAFVRTNLGFAKIARKEIIKRVEKGEIKLDEAWYDIEMVPESDLVFKIVLPLHEAGFFQAKCFFIPENHTTPIWPQGDNYVLNVEPAGTICGNIIYNAFVRQFASTKSCKTAEDDLTSAIKLLDKKGYTVIPESGKFRDLKEQVEFIFSKLGCRILHLLPIHPTPTTYARMGRFGSPYAALNFTDVDPALAQFDPAATPMEQFMELVDMVHYYKGYLFMDIAINHTGWAASIHESNPEWLVRDDNGEIQAPGAWGVVWADLTRLDYSKPELWKYMADVFLLWCSRGVDGFRCDAGYMVPVNAWEYIVAKVRIQYPETLFFLEGLGGPVKTTCDILGRANFNWAYSELFQNYSRDEISNYLPKIYNISNRYGAAIHFAETHDNNRLASVSRRYAKMRTSLCALFSIAGGFGFANGVEWFATRKIDVHESSCLNWGDENNQVEHIARLNLILKNHPCFMGQAKLGLIQNNQCEGLVLLRFNEAENEKLLILINLDCENINEISWNRQAAGINETKLYDLISNSSITIKQDHDFCSMQLKPGEVMALTPDFNDIKPLKQGSMNQNNLPGRVYLQ